MPTAPKSKPAKKPAPRKPARPRKPGRPARATSPVTPPPPAEPSALPLRPADLAALGREVGEAFKADPANREAVARLKLAAHLGLRGYDPTGRVGAAYRVYCGLFDPPAEPVSLAEFPLHRLEVEVVDFWHDTLPGVGGPVKAVMIANSPAFSEAFVAAVVR